MEKPPNICLEAAPALPIQRRVQCGGQHPPLEALGQRAAARTAATTPAAQRPAAGLWCPRL